jgi:hypothetical protein
MVLVGLGMLEGADDAFGRVAGCYSAILAGL